MLRCEPSSYCSCCWWRRCWKWRSVRGSCGASLGIVGRGCWRRCALRGCGRVWGAGIGAGRRMVGRRRRRRGWRCGRGGIPPHCSDLGCNPGLMRRGRLGGRRRRGRCCCCCCGWRLDGLGLVLWDGVVVRWGWLGWTFLRQRCVGDGGTMIAA